MAFSEGLGVAGGVMNTVYRPAFPIIGGGVDSLLIGIAERSENFPRKNQIDEKMKENETSEKGTVFLFLFFYSRERKRMSFFMRASLSHKTAMSVSSILSYFLEVDRFWGN